MARLSDTDIKLIRVFRAVVECNGFGGAQLMLNVSQPTISAHMRALEERLGFRLCQRGRMGFRLTKKGAEVYERSKGLLAAIEAFEADMGELREELTGTLRVGLVDNIINDPDLAVTDVLRRFSDRAPNVFIHLNVNTPDMLERELLNGQLQIALGPFANRSRALEYEPIYREPHSLYCGRGHPLFDRPDGEISREDVAAARFVTRVYMDGSDIRTVGGSAPKASVSNMEAQAILILSGRFIGYLPDHYAAAWVRRGRLRPIRHLGLEMASTFSLVRRRGAPGTLIERTFTGELRRLLGHRRSGLDGSTPSMMCP